MGNADDSDSSADEAYAGTPETDHQEEHAGEGEENAGGQITMETDVDGVEMATDANDPDANVLFNKIRCEAQDELDELDNDAESEASSIIMDAAEEMGQVQAQHGDAVSKPRAPGKLSELCKGWSSASRHHAHDIYEAGIEAYKDNNGGGDGGADDKIKCSRLKAILQESLTFIKKTRTTDLDTVDVSAKIRFDIDPSDFEEYEFTDTPDGEDDSDDVPLVEETVVFSMPWKQATQGKSLWQAFTAATSRNHVGEYSGRNADVGNWFTESVDALDDENIKEVVEVGHATGAIRALAGEVNQSQAYGNHSDALEEDALYLDEAPPDHSEIWIPQQMVASVRSQHEVTSRKMQEEISDRGLNAMEGGKVSYAKFVNGKRPTWWRVKPEFVEELVDPDEDDFEAFTADDYAEEAETPQDRAGNEVPDPGIVTSGDDSPGDEDEGEEGGSEHEDDEHADETGGGGVDADGQGGDDGGDEDGGSEGGESA